MNARFRRHFLVRTLGSVQMMIILTLIFALGCAVATFIEAGPGGTPAARAQVYDALWFELVIGLLVLNLIILLFARMPYRASQSGFVIVHISMIVILVSAGITRFFGYEGIMPIREGESTDYILSSKDQVQLYAGEESAYFPVQLYKKGETGIAKNLELGDARYRVAVAEFFPRFSEEIVEAEDGVPALRFATVGERGMIRHSLLAGGRVDAANVRVRLHEGGLPDRGGPAPLGAISAHRGGENAQLAVSRDLGESLNLGEYCVTLIEFHPDYARRDETPAPTAMDNPMVRLRIEDEQGRSAERVLFAFFPDFDMSHGGEGDPFQDLHLSYRFERRLDLVVTPAEKIRALASFPLEVVDMGSGEVESVYPVGEPFLLETGVLHRSGPFSLVVTDLWPSARRAAVHSDNPDAPSAARIRVTDGAGAEAEAVLRRGAAPQPLQVGGEQLRVAYGPRRIPLPYRLHLEDFLLLTYPGSENPASYESHVLLYDESQGIEGKPVRIYMNHPLTYRGYKHFQSSYDPDRRGTILSVNHDPGKWPTYVGYMLIGLGFILVLAKGLIWPERRRAKETA
jgi:hypothetical protein